MLRCSGALALFLTFSAPAGAEDLLSLVGRLQDSERLLAAAIETNDVTELKREGLRLSKIGGEIASLKSVECSQAAGALMSLTSDWPPVDARRRRALEQDVRTFEEWMPLCEKSVGLKAERAIFW